MYSAACFPCLLVVLHTFVRGNPDPSSRKMIFIHHLSPSASLLPFDARVTSTPPRWRSVDDERASRQIDKRQAYHENNTTEFSCIPFEIESDYWVRAQESVPFTRTTGLARGATVRNKTRVLNTEELLSALEHLSTACTSEKK